MYTYNSCTFCCFSAGTSPWFEALKKNPSRFIQPCSEGVKQWLRELRQRKKMLFLMTSSHMDFASVVMNLILG